MFFSQTRAILWKNWILRRRRRTLTLLEFVVPIISFVFIVLIRSKFENFAKVYVNETYHYSVGHETIYTRINIHDMQLLYAPKTGFTADLMRSVQLKLSLYNEGIKGFPNQEELLDYYNKHGMDNINAVVLFENVGIDVPNELKYDIKMYEKNIFWKTKYLFQAFLPYTEQSGSENYLEKGFLPIQLALDTSYIEIVSKKDFDVSLSFLEFPYPAHFQDNGTNNFFLNILPLLTAFGFIFLCPSTLYHVLEEKSNGIKSLLYMHGLNPFILWMGWFFNGFFVSIIPVIVIVCLLKYPWVGEYAAIEHSHFLVLFLFFLFYCAASISFLLVLSTIFHKPTISMIVGVLIWVISSVIYCGITYKVDVICLSIKRWLLLCPNIALFYGYNAIANFELRERNLTISNLWETPTGSSNDVTMGLVLLMLVVDSLLYILVTLYLDQLYPGPYGISKSWDFIFKRIKCCTTPRVKKEKTLLAKTMIAQVSDLTKTFGNKLAVNGINFGLRNGKITALIGPNGAGKTTTMSILAGFMNPTSGKVIIDDCEFNDENFEQIRKFVAICPQENFLFNDLTIYEQLQFFGMLKGLSNDDCKLHVELILTEKLKLNDKFHHFTSEISGGMKKAVSLGISLIGNPKILILDEPTAGIDIEGRAAIWKLIRSLKQFNTILLSTHLMEEADDIADRIIILNNGEILLDETTFSLKNKQKKRDSFDFSNGTLEDAYIRLVGSENEEEHVGQEEISQELSFGHPTKRAVNPVRKIKVLLSKRLIYYKKQWQNYIGMPIIIVLLTVLSMYMSGDGIEDVNKDGTRIKLGLNSYGETGVFYSISGSNYSLNIYSDIIKQQNSIPRKVDDIQKAIIHEGKENIAYYHQRMVIATEFNFVKDKITDVIVMYAHDALHGVAVSLNVATNTLLKFLIGEEYSIKATNTPLHSVEEKIENVIELSSTKSLIFWITVFPLGPLFIVSNVILITNADNSSMVKKLLYLNGINPFYYWIINYLCDFLYCIIFLILSALIGWLVSNVHTHIYELGTLISILILYATATIPIAYVFSYSKNLESACLKFWLSNVIFGIITTYITLAMEMSTDENYKIISERIRYVFAINPQFTLNYILGKYSNKMVDNYNWNIKTQDDQNKICKNIPIHQEINPCCYDEISCKKYQTFFADDYVTYIWGVTNIIAITLMIVLCCWDSIGFWKLLILNKINNKDEDDRLLKDVIVEGNSPSTPLDRPDQGLIVKELKKSYYKNIITDVPVVQDVNFEVQKGQCFGILGPNGAGKSTTFRLLAKQECYSAGDIKMEQNKYHKRGYCPQQDALIGELTGREQLNMFAQLRGLDCVTVNQLLEMFNLMDYADIPSAHYSGGNKRKLNTCIAIMGNPFMIILDEPTTGVDPISRRKLWNVLEKLKQKRKCGLIISSHSMHECEALCDQLMVLKNGRRKEMGTIRALKEKYSVGFVIKIKLSNSNEEDINAIYDIFEGTDEIDKNEEFLYFRVKNTSRSDVFEKLEELKKRYKFEVCDVKESSLQEVFLKVIGQK